MIVSEFRKNEARVFKIQREAVTELLWELLNKYGNTLLDLPEDSASIFSMKWDREKNELTFYALEFAEPYKVDFERIQSFVDEEIGVTAQSLFTDRKPYKRILVDQKQDIRLMDESVYTS